MSNVPPAPNASHSPSWAHIPLEILQAELRRRQQNGDADKPEKPECGTKVKYGNYNTSLHVFALLLILALSTLACAFPILARRFPRLPIPHRFLFLSRHFGTGVLIATAFVHLLPTAFHSLTDPCLPAFWNEGYPAMAGLIAMVSVLVVVGIEMFFAMRGAGHIHGGEYGQAPLPENEDADDVGLLPTHNRKRGSSKSSGKGKKAGGRFVPLAQTAIDEEDVEEFDALHPNGESEREAWRKVSEEIQRPIDVDQSDSDLDLDELDPTPASQSFTGTAAVPSHRRSGSSFTARHSRHPSHVSHRSHNSAQVAMPSDPIAAQALERRLLLQVLLLEAGILFHSIFIGVALSVSQGPPFAVLLVAISFHQTFEGLALGARIAAIPTLSPSSLRPWLMALAYGATTPIGQAIGLAVHGMYDPHSETGLLMVGAMNAISSGLLLFAGLVELLAEDFLSEESYKVLVGKSRKEACASVVAGGLLMAAVGAFA